MKKVIAILILIAVVFSSPCFAGQGVVQRVFNDESCSQTEVATSRGFLIKSSGYFGAWIKATGPQGSPNIDVVYEMSYDDVDANYATPVTATQVLDDCTAETPQIVTISPTPMKYIRFKAYGNAANTTGTTVTMNLFTQD